jgi:hypothetical protein
MSTTKTRPTSLMTTEWFIVVAKSSSRKFRRIGNDNALASANGCSERMVGHSENGGQGDQD